MGTAGRHAFCFSRILGAAALAIGVTQAPEVCAADGRGRPAPEFQLAAAFPGPGPARRVCCLKPGQNRPAIVSEGECNEVNGQVLGRNACRREPTGGDERDDDDGTQRRILDFFKTILEEERFRGETDNRPAGERTQLEDLQAGTAEPDMRRWSQPQYDWIDQPAFDTSEGMPERSEAVRSLSQILAPRLPAGVDPRTGDASLSVVGRTMTTRTPEGETVRTRSTVVTFPLASGNIPFSKFSNALIAADHNGRARFIRIWNIPVRVGNTTPTFPWFIATNLARGIFRGMLETLQAERIGRIRVSRPRREIFVTPDRIGRLSYALTVSAQTDKGDMVYKYWISARDFPMLLFWEDRVHRVSGKVSGTVWDVKPEERSISLARRFLPYVRLTGSGGTMMHAGPDGSFRLDSDSGSLKAELDNKYIKLSDFGEDRTVTEQHEGRSEDGELNIAFARSDEAVAQVSAYYWATRVIQFINRHITLNSDILKTDQRDLLPRLQVIVNHGYRAGEAECQAKYLYDPVIRDLPTLKFYQKKGDDEEEVRCANTAVGSMVAHEMGHAFDEAKGGIMNNSLTEGGGDALSVLFFRRPCIGPGVVPGECLRNAETGMMFDDQNEDIYKAGLNFAGFTWEFVQQLIDRYRDEEQAYDIAARIIIGSLAMNPRHISEAVHFATYLVDSGLDVQAAGPHYCELKAAAAARNIPLVERLESGGRECD